MSDLLYEVASQLAALGATVKKHDNIARAILEASPDGIVVVGRSGDIILVNQAFEVLSGYDRKELIDKPIELVVPRELRTVHREHRETYYVHPEPRDMAAGTNLQLKRADDALVPVMIRLYPARSNGDRYVVAIVRKRDG